MNDFYVYVYLDPRKPGKYVYGEYEFDYEPFYVGKGKGKRAWDFNRRKYGKNFLLLGKIKKIKSPIVSLIKENLQEVDAFIEEINLISSIGRVSKIEGPLCNMTDGGDGVSGLLVSEETRKKISDAGKGRVISEETKKKIKKANTGKIRSETVKKNISEGHKGIASHPKGTFKHSEKTKLALREINLGNKANDITRMRISNSLKGKVCPIETREKISIANKGKKDLTKEQIKNICDSRWTTAATDLCEQHNVTPTTIRRIWRINAL
jgi:hypothetical protein